jgi:glucosamine--fructose-6-phosphate aminotransferase (isomerizing)
MCGIVGYIGKQPVIPELIEGLRRMEYRGYDSWGVAALTPGGLFVEKKVGAIGDGKLDSPPADAVLGIAHTRWATHGGVTVANTHPHASSDGRFVVAQNGIVENYLELKAVLEKQGCVFHTPTDTEAIVRLIEKKLHRYSSFAEAVRYAFLELSGRNTIIALDTKTQSIVAVRNGSPLVMGHLKDGGVLLASDTLPLSGKTKTVTYIDDFRMVTAQLYKKPALFDVKSGKKLRLKKEKLELVEQKADKAGFDHFMLKEIVEQQHTVVESTGYSEQELQSLIKALAKARHIYTVGAGTASLAAGQIARFLRVIAGLPAQELRSYEIDSFVPLFSKDDLLIAVSQSGETADTLEAVKKAQDRGVKLVSIVNMIGSTLSRISEQAYLSRCGPEICVASTKAYTAQISWGYLVAMAAAGKYEAARKRLEHLAGQLRAYLVPPAFRQLKQLAKALSQKRHFFVIGKDQHFYSALEAALKIKEITYKHFEGFAAGELKHGVIALIDKGTPVFGIVGDDEHQADVLSALAEVKVRGALTIGIAAKPNAFFDIHVPVPDVGELDPVIKIVPFQLLSYFLGAHLGHNPDKPRNLAKSVTVK